VLRTRKDFARAMLDRRLERGWKQKAVALELGVSQQAVGGYEQGSMPKDPAVLARVAEFLDRDVSELAGLLSRRGPTGGGGPLSDTEATLAELRARVRRAQQHLRQAEQLIDDL
jgi:transcriptional regulator with XRE-family HTH domain